MQSHKSLSTRYTTKNVFIELSDARQNETLNVTFCNSLLVSLDMIATFYIPFDCELLFHIFTPAEMSYFTHNTSQKEEI